MCVVVWGGGGRWDGLFTLVDTTCLGFILYIAGCWGVCLGVIIITNFADLLGVGDWWWFCVVWGVFLLHWL